LYFALDSSPIHYFVRILSFRSQLGFVWDVSEYNFQKFYAALRHFARLQGSGPFAATDTMASRASTTAGIGTPLLSSTERLGQQRLQQLQQQQQQQVRQTKALRVPSTFAVPVGDASWPRGLWGYPLGTKCSAVRQKELYVKGHVRRKQLLEELGFRWNGPGNSDLGWLKVVHAAAIYSRLNGRTLDVPYHFVVPAPPSRSAQVVDSWPWPEELWGLKLGQRLKDVRVKGAYLNKGASGESRRRQLDALGFNWNPKKGRKKAFTTSTGTAGQKK